MPLIDHFHTTSTLSDWESLHAGWPMVMAHRLNSILPKEYLARIRVHLGAVMEVDLGTLERESPDWSAECDGWEPAAPAILLDTELPEPSEYEVNLYTQDEFRLVAAIELVSPSNKDRAEHRNAFTAKCETLLKKGVCVTVIDLVTNRTPNLYGELLDELLVPQTAVAKADLYAVTCRGRQLGPRWRLESWEHELEVGSVLPTLPIWLSADRKGPLDLEATYREACRSLRIR